MNTEAFRNYQKWCFLKIGVIKFFQSSQENSCARISFLIKFIKKVALTQVFSCEFCKIFMNTNFTEHLRTTASVNALIFLWETLATSNNLMTSIYF